MRGAHLMSALAPPSPISSLLIGKDMSNGIPVNPSMEGGGHGVGIHHGPRSSLSLAMSLKTADILSLDREREA